MTADLPPWEQPDDLTVDLFAGPGGWDEGARMVGLPGRIIGVEWDEAACATAEAAGHPRHRGDLSMLAVDHFGPFRGLIASPPCQAWSTAGKGLGKLDQPRILAHLERIREAGRWLHYSREGWHDDRSPLVLEPVRWALLGRPEWIACEQVPAVLPFWQAFGAVLGDHGYDAATGKLSAEQYGVPQTRQRAILVATRTGSAASLPAPTHQGYTKRKPFDPESPLPRWVSIAEAIGVRGETTLNHRRGAGMTERYGDRPGRTFDEPAFALTSKARSWEFRSNQRPGGSVSYLTRTSNQPAPTITSTSRSARMDGEKLEVSDAAVLQSFPRGYPFSSARSKQFELLGNAIPPLLAAAILGNLHDLPAWRDVCMSMRAEAVPERTAA